jgi:hypothetical protein
MPWNTAAAGARPVSDSLKEMASTLNCMREAAGDTGASAGEGPWSQDPP